MTDRFDQASALVRNSKTKLTAVENAYKASLNEKEVNVDLQIGIKEIIDGLRSALDYVAYELAKKHGALTGTWKVYFPIAARGANADDFKSLVGRNISGLVNNRPDLVSVLEGFQEAYEMAKGSNNPGAMTGANRELGKMCGYYEPEKKKIEVSQVGSMGHLKYLESLTDEELMGMLGDEGMCPK